MYTHNSTDLYIVPIYRRWRGREEVVAAGPALEKDAWPEEEDLVKENAWVWPEVEGAWNVAEKNYMGQLKMVTDTKWA